MLAAAAPIPFSDCELLVITQLTMIVSISVGTAALKEVYIGIMELVFKGDMSLNDLGTKKGKETMNTLFADVIQNEFKNAEIKIAGLNVWDKSKNIIHTDFALYENTVIKAPMSKDSSEYKEFVRIYNRETKEGML